MRENSTVYYLLTDHLGSTAITANSSGNRVAELRYKAWGETRYADGTTPTTFRFTGQREDATIGLYFYNARYYDPALGRFIAPDTIVPEPGNPQALNRYAYTRNNPLRYTDPTGHFTEDELRQWGITDELMGQWKQDFAWWVIIEAAQLGDLVQSVGRLTGSAGIWRGIFNLYPHGGQPMLGMATTEDRGWVGMRDRGVLDPETFRARTQDVGRSLWRPNERGNKQEVRTPQYLVGPASGWIKPGGPNWSPIMGPVVEGAAMVRVVTGRFDPFTPNELTGAPFGYSYPSESSIVAQTVEALAAAGRPSLAGQGPHIAMTVSLGSFVYNAVYDNWTHSGPYYVGQYLR